MVKVVKLGQYLGEFRHNLTEKHRLALPKRIRTEIDSYEVILLRGFESCLLGYDREKWMEASKQPLSIPLQDQQGRDLRRKLFGSAVVLELDGQGRMVIPESHLSWAELTGNVGEEVVIVGAGDHFEIWKKEKWEEYSQKNK